MASWFSASHCSARRWRKISSKALSSVAERLMPCSRAFLSKSLFRDKFVGFLGALWSYNRCTNESLLFGVIRIQYAYGHAPWQGKSDPIHCVKYQRHVNLVQSDVFSVSERVG